MTDLRQAAQAVVDRWDSLSWSWSEKTPTADLMAALRTALEQQAEPLTCAWSPEDDDTMPGTYRSGCGELWSFIDGSWKDNQVRFCHGCGGEVIDNIKEQP